MIMVSELSVLCADLVGRIYNLLPGERLKILFSIALPSHIVVRILLCLPFNKLLKLECDLPHHSGAFLHTWQTLSLRCAKCSIAFRKRLEIKANANEKSSNLIHCKEILINAYFQEIVDICSRKRQQCSSGKPSKRSKPAYILQEAFGHNSHDISDNEMLVLLFHHVTEFSLRNRNLELLLDKIKMDNFSLPKLESIRLVLNQSSYSYISSWKTCLENVMRRAEIKVVSISSHSFCNTTDAVIKLFSKMKMPNRKFFSMWDEAVLDAENINSSDCSSSDCGLYDNMLPGDKTSPGYVPDSLERNFYQITELHLSVESIVMSDNVHFKNSLATWFTLENITVIFPRQVWIKEIDSTHEMRICSEFTKGICALISSGCSKLRNLTIQNGIWSPENLAKIGESFNNCCNCSKESLHVMFDSCCVGTRIDKDRFKVSSCGQSTGASILNLVVRDIDFTSPEWCQDCLKIFMFNFKSKRLKLSSKDIFFNMDPLLSYVVRMWENNNMQNFSAKFITVAIEKHLSSSTINALLKRISAIKNQNMAELTLLLLYHQESFCPSNVVTQNIKFLNLKNVSFQPISNDDLIHLMHSAEDYVSQM